MNRPSLQLLSRERLADARALLRSGRYAGAYYLAGYAVECALKACIAKQFRRHDFPSKKLSIDSHTHDFTKLVISAGLEEALSSALATDEDLERNWRILRKWSTEDRYNSDISNANARQLYRAITARQSGVMRWLRNYW